MLIRKTQVTGLPFDGVCTLIQGPVGSQFMLLLLKQKPKRPNRGLKNTNSLNALQDATTENAQLTGLPLDGVRALIQGPVGSPVMRCVTLSFPHTPRTPARYACCSGPTPSSVNAKPLNPNS